MIPMRKIDGLHRMIESAHEYRDYTQFLEQAYTYIYLLNDNKDCEVEILRDIFHEYLKNYFPDDVRLVRFTHDDFCGYRVLRDDEQGEHRYTEGLAWVKNDKPLFSISQKDCIWKYTSTKQGF